MDRLSHTSLLGGAAPVSSSALQVARNAMEAGFAGVELHAANGYLVNQFIDSNANDRTDEDGGRRQNRLRFLGDVARAQVEGAGDAARVGIRLAPLSTLNGCVDADPDLPARLRQGAPLNVHERETLFGGDARGLTDDPALDAA